MMQACLSSLDLHLRFPAAAVVETAVLEDTACGIYPCYYRRLPDRLLVAVSAAALVVQSGVLECNPAFRPREYLQGSDARQWFVHGTARLPKTWKETAKRTLPEPWLRRMGRDRFWYESWETVDSRVHKLRPFERVTATETRILFEPEFSLRGPDELVELAAAHVTRFVQEIESACADCRHVMMIGGLDSQILALVPKLFPDRWDAFSAVPNHALVSQWMGWNGVQAGRLFCHDNVNDETAEDTRRKLVCSDLYSDPRHMRWLPALRRIAESLGGRCIFWAGSAGDALHVGRTHYRRYVQRNPSGFFDIHLTRVPCLVGNYHQVVKNVTGSPLLCPYHSAEIWNDVYRRHGPSVIPAGLDLRPRIGERLAGRSIRWRDRSPAPAPYRYAGRFDARAIYLRHIREKLAGGAS